MNDEDEFLQSLAEGGMQVGELACMYHPGGQAITTLNSLKAICSASGSGRWPLYFLDFEALRLAIPYVKGRRPGDGGPLEVAERLPLSP